jgi:capsular exopolysaccharide synthesis family protein
MDPQLEEPDLRSYLGVIARRRWLVILTTLIFLGIALAVSLIPAPKYRVKAQVQTTGVNDPISLIFGDGGGDLDRQAASELAYLNSTDVRFAAATAYNGSLDDSEVYNVATQPVQGQNQNVTSSVVELSLVSSDPEDAATLLNVYANAYVELREIKQAETLITQQDLVQNFVAQTEADIAEARRPISELEAQINAGNASDADRARLDALRAERAAELDPLYARLGELRGRINDLQFGVTATSSGNAQVLSAAGVPSTPVSPNIPLNIAIGVVFGLFLGAALAFVRDYFDDSVKTKEVVERFTGLSTLGLIPKVEGGQSELITVTHPSAPAAEAFRSLRTAVKFLAVERQVRVVQVTSPSPAEGKTFCAVNLAVAFAQAGDRVVVVGGDLRRPRLERILDVPLTPGLTGVLIGDVTLPQAIQTVAGVPNLSVLPAGQPPPNPSELLSGERARRLVDVLGQTYDLVIIDCPPVLPVTDSLIVARMVDTSLLVTSAHQTSKRGLVRAVELLRQVNAPLAGTVLNGLSENATFGSEPYRYDTVAAAVGGSRRGSTNGNGAESDYPYDEGGPADENGGRRFGRRGREASGEWPPAPMGESPGQPPGPVSRG